MLGRKNQPNATNTNSTSLWCIHAILLIGRKMCFWYSYFLQWNSLSSLLKIKNRKLPSAHDFQYFHHNLSVQMSILKSFWEDEHLGFWAIDAMWGLGWARVACTSIDSYGTTQQAHEFVIRQQQLVHAAVISETFSSFCGHGGSEWAALHTCWPSFKSRLPMDWPPHSRPPPSACLVRVF